MSSPSLPESFWGAVELESGTTALGRLAERGLQLRREVREWRVSMGLIEDSGESAAGWRLLGDDEAAFDELHSRVVFGESPRVVRVEPALPDRSLVVRPVTEVTVPPGEHVSIFVSAPLWVRLTVGDPPSVIFDQPLERPPDTWFGESTRAGELCYSGRTVARLNLENVTVPPGRAVTEIGVRNDSGQALGFTRLRLPLLNLSLYRDDEGILWTQPASLVSDEGSLARLRIESVPDWLAEKTLVQPPRIAPDRNLVDRTFGLFFKRSEAFDRG